MTIGQDGREEERNVHNLAVARSWFSAPMAFLLRESASGFFLRLTMLLGLFAFIVLPLPSGVKNLLTDSTARVAGAILQMIGYMVRSSGPFIMGGNFSVKVILPCTGFYEVVIFSACVLAYPATFTKKLSGLCLGLSTIYWFNIFRIVAVFLIGILYPAYFNLSHVYMFSSLSLALMAVLWLYWMDRIAGREGLNNKLSFLGRFLLFTALLTIIWTKVSGMCYFLLVTVVALILSMMGLTQAIAGMRNPSVYCFQDTYIVGFSIVGGMAFIFCLSQGRYLKRVILCCMAFIGLFGLNVLQSLFYVLGTLWTSDVLIRAGNVLIMGIMLAPFAVALSLLYRHPRHPVLRNENNVRK